MLRWFEDKDCLISFDIVPQIEIRCISSKMTKDEKMNIKLKPFINKKQIQVLLNDKRKNIEYNFSILKDYTWDGASIPRFFWRLIGSKTDNSFLIPSLIHDVLCENHSFVNYDRYFSSLVFEKLLKVSEVNFLKRWLMFHCVDNFQKFKGWNDEF